MTKLYRTKKNYLNKGNYHVLYTLLKKLNSSMGLLHAFVYAKLLVYNNLQLKTNFNIATAAGGALQWGFLFFQ